VVLLKKEEKKNNKEKENPTHSVSDGGSWTLGSTKVPGKRGKKMREEQTKGKVRRKYTSERNNSLCANYPGKDSFRDYSFPDDWEECWRHLKGKILSEQTTLTRSCFGIIHFRQLETFATGSTANLFVG